MQLTRPAAALSIRRQGRFHLLLLLKQQINSKSTAREDLRTPAALQGRAKLTHKFGEISVDVTLNFDALQNIID
ncbi:MAG TPA: hypothetical protein VN808_14885 [Stellaceae bacterium]|nr:hypothetical protein [Stellaceae bacterium]